MRAQAHQCKVVQYRLTLQSHSMGITLSFKQDATKELELDETNDSLGHMARIHMSLLGITVAIFYKWVTYYFKQIGRMTIGQSVFNSP